MQCSQCGRELREDSQFCDQCGNPVEQKTKERQELSHLALLAGILFSVLLTLAVTGAARSLGIPLIFGGLFLPFFWWKKKS
jgi:predicted nucleic acid-binding Zn ribbon protein